MRQAPTTTTTQAHLGTSLDNRAARKAGDKEARNERAVHERGDVDDAEKLDPHTLLLHLQTHMPSADRDADPGTSESNSDKDDQEMVSYSEDEDQDVPSRRDDDDTAGGGGKRAKRARGGAKRRRADEEGEGDDSAGAPPTPRRSGGMCFDFSC